MSYFIPYYFILNKTHYARYGSYYLQVMKGIDSTHPSAKEMLKLKSLSVQAKDKYVLRTAIDQKEEQTINRDAKVAGGIKEFAMREESVLKWFLNRNAQAENEKALKDLCGIGTDPGVYKSIRPSQIMRSEKLVSDVVQLLVEGYVNPF